MSDLFFNKIAAAGLASALVFIGINKIAGVAVHADIPSTPAYSKYVADESATVVDIPAPFPQAEWIAGIDADKGAKVFKKCTSCHNADDGGKNGTGPALWNVLGRPAATGADFSYSPAMASSGLTWNYAELDEYLTNPKAYVPKTKMAFIGVKKPADRAAVIEYLRLASTTPLAALTEAAPIPGADAAVVDGEAHDVVEAGLGHDTPTEIPVAVEAVPAEKIEPAGEKMAADAVDTGKAVAEDVMDTAGDIATDVIEKVEETAGDAVEAPKAEAPKKDGDH